jgi:hypothetical protein
MLHRSVAAFGRVAGETSLEVFEQIRAASYVRQDRVGAMRKGFNLGPETPVRPRTMARDRATESALLYELSRGLHRDSSW